MHRGTARTGLGPRVARSKGTVRLRATESCAERMEFCFMNDSTIASVAASATGLRPVADHSRADGMSRSANIAAKPRLDPTPPASTQIGISPFATWLSNSLLIRARGEPVARHPTTRRCRSRTPRRAGGLPTTDTNTQPEKRQACLGVEDRLMAGGIFECS